jgi:hypothetical protein
VNPGAGRMKNKLARQAGEGRKLTCSVRHPGSCRSRGWVSAVRFGLRCVMKRRGCLLTLDMQLSVSLRCRRGIRSSQAARCMYKGIYVLSSNMIEVLILTRDYGTVETASDVGLTR